MSTGDEHRATEVWQERPGEISWRCACGRQYKHQPLPASQTWPLYCVNELELRA